MSAADETPKERIARCEGALADAEAARHERLRIAQQSVLAGGKTASLSDFAEVVRREQTDHPEVEALQRQLEEANALALLTAAAPEPTKRQQTKSHARTNETTDKRLAPAPRRVPFVSAELLAWGGWNLFPFFVVFEFPAGCWLATSASDLKDDVIGALVVLLVLAAVRYWRVPKRISLLRSGQVADVLSAEVVSEGTYYSGTTYQNVIVPVARGWKVERKIYSGPKIVTRIRYRVGALESEFYNGGREYIDGIILADPKRSGRALCVSDFSYDLERDAGGQWVAKLRPGVRIMMALTIIVLGIWIGGIVHALRLIGAQW